jgi:Cytochrome C oxidase, cbb3-type, subunit III
LFFRVGGDLLCKHILAKGNWEHGLRTCCFGCRVVREQLCRCHGSDGKGGKGPNLASAKKQEKWKDSDEKIVKKITNGGFHNAVLRKKLNSDEIKAIAAHVRTLKE